MDERRLRAWRALELGPLWLDRQAIAQQTLAAAQARSPETGDKDEAPAHQDAGVALQILPAHAAAGTAAVAPARAAEPGSAAAAVATMDWLALRAAVADCRACRLCEARKQPVFGVGPESARWLVVGEGPGTEEDASGEPFVGPAGRLLDAMLASIGLDRHRNVFIANVVKCRPPKNRNPQPDEAAACLPYLHRQIELLQPDLILLVGRVAANTLLGSDESVARLRGRVLELQSGGRRIPTVVTWHPAYLLRKPQDKALAWEDLCLAQAMAAAEAPVADQ